MSTYLRAGRARLAGILCSAVVVGTVLSACGGGSPAASSSSATTTPKPSETAFRTCLQQHGVTLPSRPPGTGTTGSGSFPQGGFPAAGSGSSPGGGGFASNPKFSQAFQACASLRPAGTGRGFVGSGADSVQLKAYLNCLSLHGVTIPTSGAAEGTALRQLYASPTAKDKAAEAACVALRPTFRRGGGSTTTTTTTVPA